jgi:hypothetical protein
MGWKDLSCLWNERYMKRHWSEHEEFYLEVGQIWISEYELTVKIVAIREDENEVDFEYLEDEGLSKGVWTEAVFEIDGFVDFLESCNYSLKP